MPIQVADPARAARLNAESKPVNGPATANRVTSAARTANTIAKLEAEILALENGLAGWKRKAKDCERLQGLLAASRSLVDQTAAKLARADAGAAELAGALRESIRRADRLEEVDEYQTALIRAQARNADVLASRVDLLTRYGQKADAKIASLEKVRALQLIGATLAGAAAAVLAYHFPLSAVLA